MPSIRLVTVAVACLCLLGGCSHIAGDGPTGNATPSATPVPQNTDTGEIPRTTETPPNKGAPEGPPNDIQFDRSENFDLTTNDSGFHYRGAVVAKLNDVGDVTFENVTLCAYDAEWNVLASRTVGTFRAGTQSARVALDSATVPKYLVIEHQSFDDREVYGGVLVRRDGGYVVEYRENLEFPPLRPSERCR